jgi:hypothetical protein
VDYKQAQLIRIRSCPSCDDAPSTTPQDRERAPELGATALSIMHVCYSRFVLNSFLLATQLLALAPTVSCLDTLLSTGLDSISVPLSDCRAIKGPRRYLVEACNRRPRSPRFPSSLACRHSHPQRVRIPPGLQTRSLSFHLPITPNSHIAVPSPDPAYSMSKSVS